MAARSEYLSARVLCPESGRLSVQYGHSAIPLTMSLTGAEYSPPQSGQIQSSSDWDVGNTSVARNWLFVDNSFAISLFLSAKVLYPTWMRLLRQIGQGAVPFTISRTNAGYSYLQSGQTQRALNVQSGVTVVADRTLLADHSCAISKRSKRGAFTLMIINVHTWHVHMKRASTRTG